MSVENLKQEIVALSKAEQQEVAAFLFHLRHADHTDEYQAVIAERLSNRDSSKWLSPEEFEKQLGQR